jgi:hypothetical protein
MKCSALSTQGALRHSLVHLQWTGIGQTPRPLSQAEKHLLTW